jgi:hypothetical protein
MIKPNELAERTTITILTLAASPDAQMQQAEQWIDNKIMTGHALGQTTFEIPEPTSWGMNGVQLEALILRYREHWNVSKMHIKPGYWIKLSPKEPEPEPEPELELTLVPGTDRVLL